jgi:hypothetical protein
MNVIYNFGLIRGITCARYVARMGKRKRAHKHLDVFNVIVLYVHTGSGFWWGTLKK